MRNDKVFRFVFFCFFFLSSVVYSQVSQKSFRKILLKNCIEFEESLIYGKDGFLNFSHRVEKIDYFSRIDSSKFKHKIERFYNGLNSYVVSTVNDTACLDMELEYFDYGVKQTLISFNRNQIIEELNTNLSVMLLPDNSLSYFDEKGILVYRTPPITALMSNDPDTGYVDVLLNVQLNGNLLIINYDGLGRIVYVDPSFTLVFSGIVSDVNSGTLVTLNGGTWNEARNADTCNSVQSSTLWQVGWEGGATSRMHRTFITADLSNYSADTMRIDSILFGLRGSSNFSSVDHLEYLVATGGYGQLTVADFSNFIGSKTGVGNPFTPFVLSDTLNTLGYSTNYRYWRFNSVGIDTFTEHLGDSVQFMILTSIETDNNDPGASNSLIYYHGSGSASGSAYYPKIIIYYSGNPTPRSPSIIALSDTSVRMIHNDTITRYYAYADTLKGIRWDTLGNVIDTFMFASKTAWDTVVLKGYDPNDHTSVMAVVFDLDTLYSSDDTTRHFTYTASPVVDTVYVKTDTTIIIKFNDNNPDTVMYQLFDALNNRYYSTGFDTSVNVVRIRKSSFDGDSVEIFTWGFNTEHNLYFTTVNGDSILLDYPLFADTIFSFSEISSIDSLGRVDSVTVYFRLDPGNNPSYTYFALQDSLSGKFYNVISSSFEAGVLTLQSSDFWYTYSEFGGSGGINLSVDQNTTYVLYIYSKNGKYRDR